MSAALTATGQSGTLYFLADAVIRLEGPQTVVLTENDPASSTVITAALAAGSYTLTLEDGWVLRRQEQDGSSTAMDAVLTSDNPSTIHVTPGTVTDLVLTFSVDGEAVSNEDGGVEIGIEVDETTDTESVSAGPSDADGDGVVDASDNCPEQPNAEQSDADLDGQGDVCDADDDNDGVADAADNCPTVFNAEQADSEGDGIGDACDSSGPVDSDGDTVIDDEDNCPAYPNENQADLDDDVLGDLCDPDDDGDGVNDAADNCPVVPNNDQADADGDLIGDACDIPVGPFTYENNTVVNIPDNSTTGITSQIPVDGDYVIASFAVSVNITHPYKGDLTVTLTSPQGTAVVLHNKSGGSADNVIITNQALTQFNGQRSLGTWRLKVTDTAGSDVGRLNSWSLTFDD